MRQQLSGPLQLQQRLVRGARVSLHAVRPACTSHMRVLVSVHPSVGGEPQWNVPRIASAVVASRLNKVSSSTPNSGVRGWHQPGTRRVRSTVLTRCKGDTRAYALACTHRRCRAIAVMHNRFDHRRFVQGSLHELAQERRPLGQCGLDRLDARLLLLDGNELQNDRHDHGYHVRERPVFGVAEAADLQGNRIVGMTLLQQRRDVTSASKPPHTHARTHTHTHKLNTHTHTYMRNIHAYQPGP